MRKLTVIFVLLLCGSVSAQVKVGEKSPEIFLDTVYNGNNMENPTLKNLENNVVVLYFWATFCKPCVSSFPKIEALHKKYENSNVKIIAITNDAKERLENFLSKANVTFPIGRDNSKRTLANYEISSFPSVFIIDKQGIVIYQGDVITEDLIEEAIATNRIEVSENSEITVNFPNFSVEKMFKYFRFSGGEDPVYNMFRGVSGMENKPYKMIDHFIIRPSLVNEFTGCVYKNTNGHIGVTYIGGTVAEILAFLREKPSPLWVKDKTQDTTLYDIVCYKKAKYLKQVYREIEQRFAEGFSFKINTVVSEQDINMLYVSRKSDLLKKEKEIAPETERIYMEIDEIASSLEDKSGQYFMVDKSLKDMFVFNNEWDFEKLYTATSDELIDFLKRRGIDIRIEKKKIKLLELNRI